MTLRKSLLATSILAATLGLTACGGSSSDDKTPTTPTNTPPTDVSISVSAIEEDKLGVVVGDLSATDDSLAGLSFSVADDRFEVVNDKLKLKDSIALNFEEEEEEEVKVEVTVKDAGGLTFSKELTLSVTDMAPTDGENVYEFASKLGEGSSVVYTGQTARHALSAEIKHYMGLMTVEYIETNNIVAADVRTKLDALWGDYDSVSESPISHLGDDLTAYEQQTFAAISSSGKELSGKIAGADTAKMYKEWEVEGNFKGVTEFGAQAKTPEGLVKHYFDLFIEQIKKVNDGDSLVDVNGIAITKAFITPEGLDLVQLVQKHTLGALMFSQGTDDYLGEGLESDNKVAQKDGVLYTKLEHQYDEGFGYFGASRNYLEYSDDEIAKKGGRDEFQGKNDIDSNGKIDLASEFVWGNSSNAAKRDRGAKVTTDFTAEAMTNFIAGRKIITDNHGTDVADFADDLKAKFNKHVFDAVIAWEKAIAATVVHYINDSIADIENIKDGEYTTDEFADYAKHWGEMKGFGLNFQFSPFSPFAESDLNPQKAEFGEAKFVEVHTLMRDTPVVKGTSDEFAAYVADLEKARDILSAAYGFAEENAKNW
jgi:hypothetical protein